MSDIAPRDRMKAAQDRQSQIFCDAIQKAIEEVEKTLGEAPILNALAGALVTVQGGMLASIENPQYRKSLRKAMERNLPIAIANAKVKGRVQVINLAAKQQ